MRSDPDALLHRHRVGRQQIPDTPKLPHFFRQAERNPNVFVHLRDSRPEKNVVFLKVFENLRRWKSGAHHYEVGVRINRPQHVRILSIVEFLPIIGVSLGTETNIVRVLERGSSGPSGGHADTPLQSVGGSLSTV